MEAALNPIRTVYQEERSFLRRTVDRTLGLFREIEYGYDLLPTRIIDYFNPKYDFVEQEKTWKTTSLGLYVFVHGLRGTPACWDNHTKLMEAQPQMDVFTPYVPFQGNCRLDVSANPVYNIVYDYAKKYPGNPICLVGVSNGARICMHIEHQLRTTSPSTPVKVSTIAAVHFGSSRMNIVKRIADLTGLRFGYDKAILNDLSLESNSTVELMQKVMQPLPWGVVREFDFFGSADDFYVPELFSSNPKLPHRTFSHITSGYNHNGIVKGVFIEQMSACHEWMNRFVEPKDRYPILFSQAAFSRQAGFWSSPADESKTDFFKRLTSRKSQREDWYQVTPFIAEFWCTLSNAGFIAVGLYHRSPELVFAGLASIISHSVPKEWLLMIDKIGVLVVLSTLIREYRLFFDNPRLGIPIVALGAINLMDAHIARSKAKTWPHIAWHISAALVANYILSYRK